MVFVISIVLLLIVVESYILYTYYWVNDPY
jgi:hypothetical protein